MADPQPDDLEFTIVQPSPPRGTCSMADALLGLYRAGALSMFDNYHGMDGGEDGFADDEEVGGDCHLIASAIMCDLTVANAVDGWVWCRGTGYFADDPGYHEYEHSWIEFDGWALDASNGQLMIRDAVTWRRDCRAHDIVERDARATIRWVRDEARRMRAKNGEA